MKTYSGQESHGAVVILDLTDGYANWRVLDPSGTPVASGEANPELPVDVQVPVEGTAGAWTLEIELVGASGWLFSAWGKLLGKGVPCPTDAQCEELPPFGE